MDMVSKHLIEHRIGRLAKWLKMKDNFIMSVQASESHHCNPARDAGPWESFEVMFPGNHDMLAQPYREYEDSDIYAFVPLKVIETIIEAHGGLV